MEKNNRFSGKSFCRLMLQNPAESLPEKRIWVARYFWAFFLQSEGLRPKYLLKLVESSISSVSGILFDWTWVSVELKEFRFEDFLFHPEFVISSSSRVFWLVVCSCDARYGCKYGCGRCFRNMSIRGNLEATSTGDKMKESTDGDLPPQHQNRVPRVSRVTGNGRSTVVGSIPYHRFHNDMETQIHHLEQEAYSSVLRAFKAQSDAITWEKESLITELRKELRVSDEEHRELLGRVNADDIILTIREWRKAGHQPSLLSTAQPNYNATIPGSTVPASRKKQKTLQPLPSLSLNPQTVAVSMQPSLSAAKRGAAVGVRGKKPKSGQTIKSAQYPSSGPTGRVQLPNWGSSGALVTNEPAGARTCDPLIGRKVMTRWPEDNNFYEAVINDYDPQKGLHALVYDMNTDNATLEWVNLKEISPDDIRWEGEVLGISRRSGHGGIGHGIKKSMDGDGAVPGAGRGREAPRSQPKKDLPQSQNCIGKKSLGDLEMLQTETVIKEVERVFLASHPDLLELEKAKKMLKDHEQTLIDALARLADASDGESDEGEHPVTHGQSMDRELMWSNQLYGENQHAAAGIENGMTGGGGRGEEGPDDGVREGRVPASDDQQEDGDNEI
ncbi:EMSY N-terminal [Macleaya cordata]|uniref:EMSY N-terminal n=1 Tax=Macleaya cordata TaxID=56857 RepID=A0A200QL68_MACCD|nr:EMSY N-terminal [Macleaya cordata]